SIKGNAALDVSSQTNLSLDDHQSASLILGEQVRRQNNIVIRLKSIGGLNSRERELSSEPGQSVTNLCLEDNDQRKDGVRKDVRYQPVDGTESDQVSDVERDYQCAYT